MVTRVITLLMVSFDLFGFTCTNSVVNYIPRPQKRIFDGQNAKLGEFPWMVSLYHFYPVNRICGASVVADRWLLTAAHCVQRWFPEEIFAVAGTVNLSLGAAGGLQRRHIRRIIVHDSFDVHVGRHDIAILKLKDKFLDGFVQAVKLPAENEEMASGSKVLVSGWGRTTRKKGFNRLPMVLKKTSMFVVSDDRCGDLVKEFAVGPFTTIFKEQLCISNTLARTSTCRGDSGSPVVKDGTRIQVGLVSWGENCGTAPKLPDVCTQISYYVSWIRSHIHAKRSIHPTRTKSRRHFKQRKGSAYRSVYYSLSEEIASLPRL